MTRTLRLIGVSFYFLAIQGCFIPYMMVRGSTEPLQAASNPTGAMAGVSSGSSCQTPCQMELPRDASVVITFTKAGCKQQMVSVFPTVSGTGIFLGGVISAMTGASYDLQPNPVVANLDCGEPVAAAPTTLPSAAAAVASDRR